MGVEIVHDDANYSRLQLIAGDQHLHTLGKILFGAEVHHFYLPPLVARFKEDARSLRASTQKSTPESFLSWCYSLAFFWSLVKIGVPDDIVFTQVRSRLDLNDL